MINLTENYIVTTYNNSEVKSKLIYSKYFRKLRKNTFGMIDELRITRHAKYTCKEETKNCRKSSTINISSEIPLRNTYKHVYKPIKLINELNHPSISGTNPIQEAEETGTEKVQRSSITPASQQGYSFPRSIIKQFKSEIAESVNLEVNPNELRLRRIPRAESATSYQQIRRAISLGTEY